MVMKINFVKKKMLVPLILVSVILVILVIFFSRAGFNLLQPARVVTETGQRIGGGLLGGSFDFGENSKELIPLAKLISGGPPKDGIPSIDEPKYLKATEANFLNEDDLVMGVEIAGDARAFPIKILNWHEIVNAEIGGVPVAVTYCPLCFSGVAFKRTINGQVVEFGVSGKLYNNDLIMYNRKAGNLKENLWQQITGQAIVGELAGRKLEKIITDTIEWSNWRKSHPQTLVLSTDTGFVRDYEFSPYGDYDSSSEVFFPVENKDDRLHPKTKVFGVEIAGKFKAYPESEIEKIIEIKDSVGGNPITIKRNPQTGIVRFFDGKGGEVTPILEFWFSWVAFHPETELYQ